jgi:hypothetical protein
MARGPCTFRQSDVARLVKAATAAGLHVTGVRVDTKAGTITVVTGESARLESNPLDVWIEKHAGKAQGH